MDLENLLKICQLWRLFPAKICRQTLFAVYSEEKQNAEGCDEDLPVRHLEFLRRIVYFNGTCRIFRRQVVTRKAMSVRARLKESITEFTDNKASYVHPLDVSTAVFLCCDDVARQDLILHFWGCKFAFPFAVKSEQLEPMILYIWPLKCLVAKYSLLNEDIIVERPVINLSFKVVGAVRFGEQPVSKSNILNLLISSPGKDHSVFFHRDLEGSVPQLSELCQGMIETFPVFDSSDIPRLFLNLRGNCKSFSDQTNFIRDVSDVVIVVFSKKELNDLKMFIKTGDFPDDTTLILIGTDLGEEDVTVAEGLEYLCAECKIDCFVVAYKGSMRFGCLTDICRKIKECEHTHNIKELQKYATANNFHLDLHGISDTIREAEEFTNNVFRDLKIHKTSDLLPVQGEYCLEWSKADLEQHKLKLWIKSENIKSYRENLERKKKLAREEQVKLIVSNKSVVVNTLVDKLEADGFDQITEEQTKSLLTNKEQIFLRAVKLNIEEEMLETFSNIYKEYRSLFDQIALNRDSIQGLTERFERLDRKLQDRSLAMSDFTREMGQIYEVSFDKDLQCTDPLRLVKAAVKLLIGGYQIEIMDGRSNCVPINWVKGVFTELQKCFGNIRVKVITVLGIQSSGKSTLLNIMFGCQFAVGSGRCTRGACMHLVKVGSNGVMKYNVDYVLVIDTEGLFSTSTNMTEFEERDRKERELATFVIGLSNVTLVNILGENLAYLKDILPISVHAFLRMGLAGLNPKCKLIHRNVQKGSSCQLLHQTYSLENLLDEYTAAACSIENVSKRRFREIIQFDITKDVTYLPPLFESLNSQDIVTCAFSKACASLKEDVMNETDAFYTLDDLRHHIGYLWIAVKRENFVYEFKNTIETKATLLINRQVCKFHKKMRHEFQLKLNAYLMDVSNCSTIAELNVIKCAYQKEVTELEKKLTKYFKTELKTNAGSIVVEQACEKIRKLTLSSFSDAVKEYSSVCRTKFCRVLHYQENEIKVLSGEGQMLRELDEYIEQHSDNTLDFKLSGKENAQRLFTKWLENWRKSDEKFLPDFHEAVVDAMYTYFPNQKAKVDEILESIDVQKADITVFLEKELGTFWDSDEQFKREKAEAQKAINELHKGLLVLFDDLSASKVAFETSLFSDIVLKVRNNRRILYEIRAKPSFELLLALALCGEFIQRLKKNKDKVLLAEKQFLIHTEQYFVSRCAEKTGEGSCQWHCKGTKRRNRNFGYEEFIRRDRETYEGYL